MLDVAMLLIWAVFTVIASWVVWRVAYAQGRADAQLRSCCDDHGEDETPMPTPDQWDAILTRILTEADRRPNAGRN